VPADPAITAESLVTSTAVLGSTVVGLAAVITAAVKIRDWIRTPFDNLEKQIEANKVSLEREMKAIKKSVSSLEVHFDPNGGDIANKIKALESRLHTIESTTTTERNDLRSVLKEVRDILTDLRDGKKEST
jgi:hypothetical protein